MIARFATVYQNHNDHDIKSHFSNLKDKTLQYIDTQYTMYCYYCTHALYIVNVL